MKHKTLIMTSMLALGGYSWASKLPSHSIVDSLNKPHQQNHKAPYAMQKIRGESGTQLFFEDFEQTDPNSPALPNGWVVFDVDGQTPDPVVAQFTAAWIATDDPDNAGSYNIQSTSFYNPPGQADDWVITPAINLTQDNFLFWRARAQDPERRDGYTVHVSTSGATVAGCQANPAIFSIANEQANQPVRRYINLESEGYGNQQVHICFRNNSVDRYILMLDDIEVVEPDPNDLSILGVSPPPPYTKVPDNLNGYDIPVQVQVANLGANDQVDITVEAEISRNGVVVANPSMLLPGPLVSGANTVVDLGPYTATNRGMYDVVYNVTIDGVIDDNPSNNTTNIPELIEVTARTMSKDDGLQQGDLGIGAGDGGYLGNQFGFDVPVTLSGVNFIYSNDNCDPNMIEGCALDGEMTQVDVFAIDEMTGKPDNLVASTEAMVIPAGPISSVETTLDFTSELVLPAGDYVFAVQEPVRTTSTYDTVVMQLGYSLDRYTPNTTWVDWPSNPSGDWVVSDDLQLPSSYMIRVIFAEADVIFADDFE